MCFITLLEAGHGKAPGIEGFLMGMEEVKEDTMLWGHGDLSLISGVTAASKGKVKPGVPASRRVMKHMRYDKNSGQFVPNKRKKQNRVQVTVKVDEKNFKVLHGMLHHASGDKVAKEIRVPDKRMYKEAVGDTGAIVCCSGPDTMGQLGLKVHELLVTDLTLFAADNKSLTVMGALPVMITVPTADGSTVSTRDLLYIVEELSCMFPGGPCVPAPPTAELHWAQVLGWVTGWGQDAFQAQGQLQARLQEVDVPVVGHRTCEKALKREGLGQRFKLHPGWLCAGGEDGKDACSGDGGGPLVCQEGDSMELAGLVSWGVGCGKQGVPGVYTNIAAYVHWIRETISLL